mmetsp:Transcript_79876/g.258772  ORF Transcript_79876/g.258772 Transcript_79876/m.258772 type:complete len:796 (-) Transcript_79876:497-2884(-)
MLRRGHSLRSRLVGAESAEESVAAGRRRPLCEMEPPLGPAAAAAHHVGMHGQLRHGPSPLDHLQCRLPKAVDVIRRRHPLLELHEPGPLCAHRVVRQVCLCSSSSRRLRSSRGSAGPPWHRGGLRRACSRGLARGAYAARRRGQRLRVAWATDLADEPLRGLRAGPRHPLQLGPLPRLLRGRQEALRAEEGGTRVSPQPLRGQSDGPLHGAGAIVRKVEDRATEEATQIFASVRHQGRQLTAVLALVHPGASAEPGAAGQGPGEVQAAERVHRLRRRVPALRQLGVGPLLTAGHQQPRGHGRQLQGVAHKHLQAHGVQRPGRRRDLRPSLGVHERLAPPEGVPLPRHPLTRPRSEGQLEVELREAQAVEHKAPVRVALVQRCLGQFSLLEHRRDECLHQLLHPRDLAVAVLVQSVQAPVAEDAADVVHAIPRDALDAGLHPQESAIAKEDRVSNAEQQVVLARNEEVLYAPDLELCDDALGEQRIEDASAAVGVQREPVLLLKEYATALVDSRHCLLYKEAHILLGQPEEAAACEKVLDLIEVVLVAHHVERYAEARIESPAFHAGSCPAQLCHGSSRSTAAVVAAAAAAAATAAAIPAALVVAAIVAACARGAAVHVSAAVRGAARTAVASKSVADAVATAVGAAIAVDTCSSADASAAAMLAAAAAAVHVAVVHVDVAGSATAAGAIAHVAVLADALAAKHAVAATAAATATATAAATPPVAVDAVAQAVLVAAKTVPAPHALGQAPVHLKIYQLPRLHPEPLQGAHLAGLATTALCTQGCSGHTHHQDQSSM